MRARWRKELDQAESEQPSPFNRGDKVRLKSDPQVVLRVREVDPFGKLDGSGKVLCFNSFGHGQWLPIADLESVVAIRDFGAGLI